VGGVAGSGTIAEGRAESLAFDPASALVFTSNLAAGRVDFFRLDGAGGLTAVGGVDLAGLPSYGGVNGVAVKNGVLAVAYQNAAGDQAGFVALYDLAGATGVATLRQTVQVGVLPDQVVFTPDGSRLLVANEGTALSALNDPAGSVSIIDVASATVTNTIGFGSLAGEELTLRERGLATLTSQPVQNDLEPEYITISPDGARAYVTLQEANAVAVIDLTNPSADRPLSIQPLGFIDRSLPGNSFDPSDQPAGIGLFNAPVRSLPQPDAIASFAVGGATYFITANEGDARENLSDSVRLGAAGYVLDPTAFPNAAALKANAQLGRLNVLTNLGDANGDGDFDQIFTLGGRGVSIFRQNADGSIEKVRETGGEFEAIIAAGFPAIFNINQGGTAIDNRSDDKGPEPEGVDVGVVGGRTYAFIALERVNGVMVYDVTDPANASFVGYRPGPARISDPRWCGSFRPPTARRAGALVLTANEISGTTTVYRVETAGAGATRSPARRAPID
jgi:hypothetical protein